MLKTENAKSYIKLFFYDFMYYKAVLPFGIKVKQDLQISSVYIQPNKIFL